MHERRTTTVMLLCCRMHEYDKLYRELEDFEAQYPQYRSADSPTTQVGGAASQAFAPVEHLQQMTSLDDVFSLEELAAWETEWLTIRAVAIWTCSPR